VLGMDETFKPRFVRRYATLGATIKEAIAHYVADVRGGAFPSDAESFSIAENKATPSTIEPAPYSSAGKK
jgi:3-methyl-2-oxobutanoate hydroxymethyltransferase